MNEQMFIRRMITVIDSFPKLKGCLIGYHDGMQSRLLRETVIKPIPEISSEFAVLLEKYETSDPLVLADAQRWVETPGGSPENAPNPMMINRSKFVAEATGANISCIVAVVSFGGVAASLAGEIPSFGLSSFLLAASWVSFASSAIQCVNGLVRSGADYVGGDEVLTEWDNNYIYKNATFLVDYVGVSTSVVSLSAAAKDIWLAARLDQMLAAKGLNFIKLKILPKPQQKEILLPALKELMKTRQGRAIVAKQFRQANAAHASDMLKVINNSSGRVIDSGTVKRIAESLRKVGTDVVTSGGTILASSTESANTGSASGSVNWLIHIIEDSSEK